MKVVCQLAKPVAALEPKVVSTGPKGNFPSDLCNSRGEIWGVTHANFSWQILKSFLQREEVIGAVLVMIS